MKTIKRIEVHAEGELTVFEQTVGVIDGERVTGETVGRVVWPGDDFSAEAAQVRAVAAALHTPECIALRRARQAAGEARPGAEADAAARAVDAALAAYETARHARAEKPKR